MARHEVTVELLAITDPAGTQHFEGVGFIGIVLAQETDCELFVVLGPRGVDENILVLELSFNSRLRNPLLPLMYCLHLFLVLNPFRSLLLQKVAEWILDVIKFREETAAIRQLDVSLFLDRLVQVRVDLALGDLAHVAWQHVPG